ncbi:MAG TPA: carboxymuconolactone decarboxylase family protein [Pseudoduganella sp.]
MNTRPDFYTASPEVLKAMIALEGAVGKLDIDPVFIHLIKLRASQVNGCAFCVDMHVTEMRKAGESERRIATVAAWEDTPFFTPRERAVLAWTEAITRIADSRAPDAVYEALAAHFTPKQMVDLTLAINTINSWNRLAIGFRKALAP